MRLLVLLALFSFYSLEASSKFHTISVQVGKGEYDIHFSEEKRDFALRVKQIILSKFSKIHQYFDYSPLDKTHFVIENYKTANGLASVFPRNKVILYDYPPVGWGNLSFTHRWVEILVVHEYTHILTLEMTRSWMKSLRRVFGSTLKLSGILPKWISEGVAVWAESYFSQEGRIRNPLARKSVIDAFNDPRSCKSIDCLDYNQVIPHGSYPYHMGGFFLDYLEQQKPGFVSCLFKKHSSQIPFLVNRAFKKCGGESAENLFKKFQNEFKNQKSLCLLDSNKKCDFANSLIKKGIRIDWTKGFFNYLNQSVFIISSKYGAKGYLAKQRELLVINWRNHSYGKVSLNNSAEKIYKLGDDYPGKFSLTLLKKEFGATKRFHQIFELKKNKLLKKESIDKDTAYAFPGGELVEYQNSRWIQTVGEKNNKQPKLSNIYEPTVSNKKIKLKNKHPLNSIKLDQLEMINLSKKDEKEYSALSHLKYTHLFFFLRQDSNLWLSSLSTTLNDPREKIVWFLEARAYQGIKDDAAPLRFSTDLGFDLWKFRANLFYSDQLSQVSNSNKTDLNRSAGFQLSKSFNHRHSLSELSALYVNSSEDSFIAGIRDSDFIGFGYTWSYSAYKHDHILKNFSWSNSLGYETNSLELDHAVYRGSIGFNLGWNSPISLFSKIQYAKNFKDSLQGGLIQGGGASSTLTGTFPYDSYQFDYGAIVGNELQSMRLGANYSLISPMRGHGLWPINFKELVLNLGVESVKADRILNPNSLSYEVDTQVTSWFSGISLKWDIGYRFPLDVKLIYSSSLDEEFEDNRFHFLLEAPLIF